MYIEHSTYDVHSKIICVNRLIYSLSKARIQNCTWNLLNTNIPHKFSLTIFGSYRRLPMYCKSLQLYQRFARECCLQPWCVLSQSKRQHSFPGLCLLSTKVRFYFEDGRKTFLRNGSMHLACDPQISCGLLFKRLMTPVPGQNFEAGCTCIL